MEGGRPKVHGKCVSWENYAGISELQQNKVMFQFHIFHDLLNYLCTHQKKANGHMMISNISTQSNTIPDYSTVSFLMDKGSKYSSKLLRSNLSTKESELLS